ncbi:hypothetical protein OJF2_00960 [Aquisphaera giovannonii]|uniref:Uncharacterized protein n=1 Tax=Aquisphaera giovannonii TaxID=406548 RepID=A0A5B9VV15_9BACT|nr:hypothetical protein [Aquisphaera giovannonii]QEH31631.1 hypothetical protein OJF2_00960 [Aquisphaera giovannonii]
MTDTRRYAIVCLCLAALAIPPAPGPGRRAMGMGMGRPAGDDPPAGPAPATAAEGDDDDVAGDGFGRVPLLELVRRKVAQDQGAWVIQYELRYTGESAAVRTPAETKVAVEGWVSNSRVCGHATPRLSRVVAGGTAAGSAASDVIASADESRRCRERVTLTAWADDGTPPEPDAPAVLSLNPGTRIHVKVRLEHQHVIYGEYDPLLGVRSVDLSIGGAILRDEVPLDREHHLAMPRAAWPEPPADRRDPRHYVSAPDSLHLEAHVPGHKYYRLPDRPVRYGTKMRLRFWYLIAAGTEGECRVRFDQYKDTPTSWRVLSSGGFEQPLEAIGRWTKVEKIVRTDCEATTVALGFRIISETDVGEMWIDDVSLEPVCQNSPCDEP